MWFFFNKLSLIERKYISNSIYSHNIMFTCAIWFILLFDIDYFHQSVRLHFSFAYMFTVPAQMIKQKFILSLLGLTTLQIVILVPKFRMGKIWQNLAKLCDSSKFSRKSSNWLSPKIAKKLSNSAIFLALRFKGILLQNQDEILHFR